MPRITRKLEFDAGHRVLNHEGKCRYLHGHRYVAEITVDCPRLDDLGRVVDFGVIKEKVGGWIDTNWDHNMILHPDDPLLGAMVLEPGVSWSEPHSATGGALFNNDPIWSGRDPYIMPQRYANPTAENIAAVLFNVSQELLSSHSGALTVSRVRIYETPNCYADHLSERTAD